MIKLIYKKLGVLLFVSLILVSCASGGSDKPSFHSSDIPESMIEIYAENIESLEDFYILVAEPRNLFENNNIVEDLSEYISVEAAAVIAADFFTHVWELDLSQMYMLAQIRAPGLVDSVWIVILNETEEFFCVIDFDEECTINIWGGSYYLTINAKDGEILGFGRHRERTFLGLPMEKLDDLDQDQFRELAIETWPEPDEAELLALKDVVEAFAARYLDDEIVEVTFGFSFLDRPFDYYESSIIGYEMPFFVISEEGHELHIWIDRTSLQILGFEEVE